jgi:hypothetical protein
MCVPQPPDAASPDAEPALPSGSVYEGVRFDEAVWPATHNCDSGARGFRVRHDALGHEVE